MSTLLDTMGIDSRRYRLLMDLFKKLSSRQEISLGRAGMDVQMILLTYSVLAALASGIMVLARLSIKHPVNEPAAPYLTIFMFITAVALLGVLLSETANLLVNPVEGLALAHYPINGATYSAAKLTHLVRIILYGVFGINIVPAFLILVTNEVRWFYPINHLLATLAVGFLIAIVCCSTFGLLIRFLRPSRLKSIGQAAQFLPIILMAGFRVARGSGITIPSWVPVFWPAQLFLFGQHVSRPAAPAVAIVFACACGASLQRPSVEHLRSNL